MARDITAAYITAVENATLRIAYLVLMDFPAGDLQLWSGSGNLSWDSLTWTGTGTLGGISNIEEAKGTQAPGVQLSLSGIPSAMLALALTDTYQGRSVKIWQALFTDAGVLVVDPALIFSGVMDVMEITDAGETGVITLSCVGGNAELSRNRRLRYTQNEQERLFTGDLGLQYVAGLQDKPVHWGTKTFNPGSRVPGDYDPQDGRMHLP